MGPLATAREDSHRRPSDERQFPGDVRLFLVGIYADYIGKAFFLTKANSFPSCRRSSASRRASRCVRSARSFSPLHRPDRPPQGLIVTLSIMACGTVLIAFVPAYATIGLAAPLLW